MNRFPIPIMTLLTWIRKKIKRLFDCQCQSQLTLENISVELDNVSIGLEDIINHLNS